MVERTALFTALDLDFGNIQEDGRERYTCLMVNDDRYRNAVVNGKLKYALEDRAMQMTNCGIKEAESLILDYMASRGLITYDAGKELQHISEHIKDIPNLLRRQAQ